MDLEPKPGMCVKCGSLNAIGLTKCGNCGADILVPIPPTPPKPEEAKPISKCQWCGNPVKDDEDTCQECRNRLVDSKPRSVDSKLKGPSFKKSKPSRRLVLGGIFMMLTGIATLGVGLMLLFIESLIVELSGYGTGIGTCGAIMGMLGLGALAGGLFAMWKVQFFLVLAGSICSLLCVASLIGAMLGLIGMIFIGIPLGLIGPWLVSATREEFD